MSDQELSLQTEVPSDSESHEVSQDEQQCELYARYLEQQRRMSCLGCGESSEVF